MKLRKIITSAVATAMLATSCVMPYSTVYAVESFANVESFISDVLDISLSGISASSLSTALVDVTSRITTSGDEVLYEGSSIGYWYGDDSTSLYSDSTKTTALIEKTASGYKVDPTLLPTLVEDVNNGIIEVLTPTTDDWSKIVGKYDIQLGGKTIPKEQWITMDIQASDDWNNTSNLTNFTSITGKSIGNMGVHLSRTGADSSGTVNAKAWIVDENGDLYISNGLTVLADAPRSGGYPREGSWSIDTIASEFTQIYTYKSVAGSQTTPTVSITPYVKVKLVQGDEGHNNYLMPEFMYADVGNTQVLACCQDDPWNQSDLALYELRKVADPSEVYSGTMLNIKASGILWATGSQLGLPTGAYQYHWHSAHTSMFDSFSASKTVVGNKTLSRRINTLNSLTSTDTLEVTASGWLVNDTTNIEDYLAMQTLNNAGDVADIAAVADVDPLGFNVILPTALPILVDSNNVVYVASNADITNKSGAAVKLTSVEIVPEAGSGWTSVDGTPSKIADTREFKFATSIEEDVILGVDEVYPFQYSANLSPSTEALESLELATVFVTIDWAV